MTTGPGDHGLVVEYWADYICPWCYLALDRVSYLTEQYGAQVLWRPYELHPEVPPEGVPAPRMPRNEDTTDYLRTELNDAGLGVTERRTWSNSARALALSVWAQPRGEWPALHHGLYEAYWVRSEDIGNPKVLVAVAASAGIEPAEAAEAVAGGWGHQEAMAAKEEALDLGISATPGWRFGGASVLSGAHPRTVFDRIIAVLNTPSTSRTRRGGGRSTG